MTEINTIDASILTSYEMPQNLSELNRLLCTAVHEDKHKIVVLDDDPTGVQTVHDVSVYTNWQYDSIKQGFLENSKVFYILTNSRAFTAEQTAKVHRQIGETIAKVAQELNRPYLIISRSDSTLRGHYPLETEILQEQIKSYSSEIIDGEILCPYFKEGGRFTINNIHYVKYGNELVPAGKTEFAKDKTFGYTSSDLTEYIEEKTYGRYKAEDVVCISLTDLRNQDFAKIEKQLCAVKNFGKVIVNAVDDCDLKVFAVALYKSMRKGKKFIFRSAAGLVKIMGAISDKPLLQYEDLIQKEAVNGGIIVIGSHTAKTTKQLEALKDIEGLEFIEFNSDLVLHEAEFADEIQRVVKLEENIIKNGRTVVVYTKRKLLTLENDTKKQALIRSVKISDAVQSLVGRLSITPAFVVAKGGITSSDVGTKALKVTKANVLGQIQPGIPVWQTDMNSRFPQIPYVIFPGNVGEDDTLKKVVETLLKIK